MDKQDLIKIAEDFVENSEYNYINKEVAISEKVVGMKILMHQSLDLLQQMMSILNH